MESGEFIAALRRRTNIRSVDEALNASRATLMTLGERLKGDEPRHLAAQLPAEIARFLSSEGMGRGEELSADEFLRRVREREGVDVETARTHAGAVVEVVYEAVTAAERDSVAEQLPRDFDALFGSPTRH